MEVSLLSLSLLSLSPLSFSDQTHFLACLAYLGGPDVMLLSLAPAFLHPPPVLGGGRGPGGKTLVLRKSECAKRDLTGGKRSSSSSSISLSKTMATSDFKVPFPPPSSVFSSPSRKFSSLDLTSSSSSQVSHTRESSALQTRYA